MKEFNGLSTTKLAEIVAIEINAKRPDAVVIESTGSGAGLIDILRDKGFRIVEIHPGSAAIDYEHWANKRAENWAKMRDWIYDEGALPVDVGLKEQLTTILYSYDKGEQKIILEAKEAMKSRGLPSPDKADSLSLTFGTNVARRDRNNVRALRKTTQTRQVDYDPIED